MFYFIPTFRLQENASEFEEFKVKLKEKVSWIFLEEIMGLHLLIMKSNHAFSPNPPEKAYGGRRSGCDS